MPGRPRTMLKRLNELLKHAEAYGSELYNLMPSQYQERPDLGDPVCAAWRRAGQAVVENYQALEALRDRVAEKVARAEQLRVVSQLERE